MTPEKFRQWIVILLAASLLTVWAGMGMQLYGINKYRVLTPGSAMARQMPGRMGAERLRRERVPFRRRLPAKQAAPAAQPAEKAK